jgi:hypothetical protein
MDFVGFESIFNTSIRLMGFLDCMGCIRETVNIIFIEQIPDVLIFEPRDRDDHSLLLTSSDR